MTPEEEEAIRERALSSPANPLAAMFARDVRKLLAALDEARAELHATQRELKRCEEVLSELMPGWHLTEGQP